MTTFSDGEEHSRQMTNFNEDPYGVMWFPTYRDTRKVGDIEKNPKVLITFPSSRPGEFYEIEGRAEFEEPEVTARKWRWWYLYWHPEKGSRFGPVGYGSLVDHRLIINVYPKSVRVVKRKRS